MEIQGENQAQARQVVISLRIIVVIIVLIMGYVFFTDYQAEQTEALKELCKKQTIQSEFDCLNQK